MNESELQIKPSEDSILEHHELVDKDDKNILKTPESLKDKYRFIRQIGSGTQGRVFLAENLSNHLQVAIKQLNISSAFPLQLPR